MGDSVLERMMRKGIDELLNDSKWALTLVKTLRDVNNNVYSKSYVDVLGQKWREKFDLYDSFSFRRITLAILEGRIAIFQIPVEAEPFPDKEVQKNNAVLKNLQYPFSGEFSGGTQGHDGYIHWDLPINALVRVEDEISFVIVEPLLNENGRKIICPLEVGYIPFEKTADYLRLAWNGTGPAPGLARWPYGQNKITVLVNYGIFAAEDDGFASLSEKVYGDFDTLPNPWESWLKG